MKNKKIAILGWGADTQDIEPWLREQGNEVTILDEKPFGYAQGKAFENLDKYDLLVRSPGVDIKRFPGLNVTSKIKIFFDECPCPIIGVTGTKGKGTTSTLIYEILKKAGKDVYLGGNIGGVGLFSFLPKLTNDSLVVLELSSFQLIDLHKSPHIAVVLMTTVDHLDWHADVDEYVGAKSQITKFQDTNDFAVINKDYPNSVKIGEQGKGQKIWVSANDWPGDLRLRGEHNRENMAAASAVGRILKIQDTIIKKVASEFKGLEHRLEEVATVNGVTYFEDSFSTTPETTIAAIKSFTEPIILIAGGSEKGSDFTELGKVISVTPNIKSVILIGDMASRIEASIISNQPARNASHSDAGGVSIIKGLRNMPEIVKKASEIATNGDVVLLSSAAASFDMFKNYKDRGDQFKAAVKSL